MLPSPLVLLWFARIMGAIVLVPWTLYIPLSALSFYITMCYRLSVSHLRAIVNTSVLHSLFHLHRILLLPLIPPSASLALSSSLPVSQCTSDAYYLAVF